MPSKGDRENKRSQRAGTSRIAGAGGRAKGAQGGSAKGPGETTKGPWTFVIVRASPAAFLCRRGEPVTGSASGAEVAVSDPQRGVLGYAPSREAAEMLAERRRHRAAALIGEVVSAGERSTKTAPTVTLRLEIGTE